MRVVGFRRIHFAFQPAVALAGALVIASCGRSELDDLEGAPTTIGAPGAAGAPPAHADAAPPVPDAGIPFVPSCQPAEEVCNGRDDDCNGQVDEVPGVPCPGGGYRYCVAGKLSDCPRRCERCIPGSERICYISYCKFWATQTCAADGRSFGFCREDDPPPECKQIADKHNDSPELEQCCIDAGYCCLDEFDLDKDGDRNEMLGSCEEVACGQ